MERKLLLAFIISILFIFLLQQITGFVEVRTLNGKFEVTKKPIFNLDSITSGSYQKNMTKWANENFGFRSTLVRFHNQLGYWAYKRSYTNGVIVGKHEYLLDKKYIDAYTGADFIGEEIIKNKVSLLRLLQDSLATYNIKLLFVIAPGKASFYKEYIPDKYLGNIKTSNYEVITKLFKSNKINHIDFRKHFDSLKLISNYSLYPKGGIHWSTYGATLAADSIIRKISYLTKTVMPLMHFDKITVSEKLNESDEDVNTGMNLLWNVENLPMAYPKVSFSKVEKKISLLTIGDSFYWTMPTSEMKTSVLKNMDFIYYNRMLNSAKKEDNISTNNIDQIHLTFTNNAIIILSTDANLSEFGWNYIEMIYNNVFNLKSESGINIPSCIAIIMNDIKHKPETLNLLKKSAIEMKIPLDSMIYLNALKLYKQKIKNGIQ